MEKSQALEELTFIKKLMVDSQKIVVDNGKQYILWSVLVVIGIVVKYLLDALGNPFNPAWLWIVVIGIGWFLSFLLKRSTYSALRVKTVTQKILESVWTGCGVAIPILALIGYFSGAIQSWAISPTVATLFGSAFFVIGTISNHTWVRSSAFAWWGGAIFMFLAPGEYSVAMLGGMFIVLQLVPGIIMYRKWKSEMDQHGNE